MAIEVDKLLKAGFVKEAKYSSWVSSIIMVCKPNGSWRMYVDYTDLNKAILKDSFPLPRMETLVD